jgi:hypothetical protein
MSKPVIAAEVLGSAPSNPLGPMASGPMPMPIPMPMPMPIPRPDADDAAVVAAVVVVAPNNPSEGDAEKAIAAAGEAPRPDVEAGLDIDAPDVDPVAERPEGVKTAELDKGVEPDTMFAPPPPPPTVPGAPGLYRWSKSCTGVQL